MNATQGKFVIVAKGRAALSWKFRFKEEGDPSIAVGEGILIDHSRAVSSNKLLVNLDIRRRKRSGEPGELLRPRLSREEKGSRR